MVISRIMEPSEGRIAEGRNGVVGRDLSRRLTTRSGWAARNSYMNALYHSIQFKSNATYLSSAFFSSLQELLTPHITTNITILGFEPAKYDYN